MSLFDYLPRLGYSPDLHRQLRGWSSDCETYSGNAVYQLTSIIMVAVSAGIMLNYYYGIFNNPRFTHRRVWFANLLAACGIVGLVSYLNAVSYLPEERHCPDLHFVILDCILFAITEMLYTAVLCLVCSLLFKWKSIANKKIPF